MKKICILLLMFHVISVFGLDTKKIEDYIFFYTNRAREKRGMSIYANHKSLVKIARIHSANMIDHDFFSHTDHKGRGPGDRMRLYCPEVIGGAGENIAYNYGSTEKEVANNLMTAWMNSPGHRANILSKKYTHLGVGIIQKGDYYYATQNFGDLVGELLDPIPESISYKSEKTFHFKYLHTVSKKDVTIYVYFPDKKAKYYMPNGSFYTGCGLYTPEWVEGKDEFLLTVTFDKGKGTYKLVMGTYGSFYPDGLIFKVE